MTLLFINEMENKNKPTLKTFDTDDSENENMLFFQTWIDAETFLNEYVLQKGFSFKRKCTEVLVEDGIKVVHKIS
ncbi:uncharacterized protein OCT59_026997 [Rhizophagus irregularis]|uniref:Uncharacterized protein n=1 Tax=Rhizophagus irregularis (strain DAOM 197198w) TaxID=1432141 RepID=A0A015KEA4_RHIIW